MLQPRLIISDVMMPEMDGFEFCREVKEDPAFKEIPVILLTGLMDPQDLVRGLDSGADYFITKPYHKDSLLSRVSNILGEKIISVNIAAGILFCVSQFDTYSFRRIHLLKLFQTFLPQGLNTGHTAIC